MDQSSSRAWRHGSIRRTKLTIQRRIDNARGGRAAFDVRDFLTPAYRDGRDELFRRIGGAPHLLTSAINTGLEFFDHEPTEVHRVVGTMQGEYVERASLPL